MNPFVWLGLIAAGLIIILIFRIPSTGERYIILPKGTEARMKKMRKQAKVKNNTQLVNMSMQTYEILLDAAMEGDVVTINKANGTAESVFILPQ
jgi:hypothetical protein